MQESNRAQDQWAAWLLHRRQGGDATLREAMWAWMARWRDRVLDNARVKPGDIVLDVGCGDGLIAFGALDRVGPSGQVIFSDISQDLLDHCADRARALGHAGQCTFLRTPADDLAVLADASVDVVTTRSVLLYVAAKPRAFQEFYRVLRPGGRVSIFEPINRFSYPEPPNRFFGYDVTPVQDLAHKLLAVYTPSEASAAASMASMLDFDERDLLRYSEQAGFPEAQLDAHFEVIAYPEALVNAPGESNAVPLNRSWDLFVRSAPNPLAPTLEEAMAAALMPAEAERFTAYLRPLVESAHFVRRMEHVYLWASKHGG
jgi:ubiquinone/menaquinone biosynthesis C-methylase UbiE